MTSQGLDGRLGVAKHLPKDRPGRPCTEWDGVPSGWKAGVTLVHRAVWGQGARSGVSMPNLSVSYRHPLAGTFASYSRTAYLQVH